MYPKSTPVSMSPKKWPDRALAIEAMCYRNEHLEMSCQVCPRPASRRGTPDSCRLWKVALERTGFPRTELEDYRSESWVGWTPKSHNFKGQTNIWEVGPPSGRTLEHQKTKQNRRLDPQRLTLAKTCLDPQILFGRPNTSRASAMDSSASSGSSGAVSACATAGRIFFRRRLGQRHVPVAVVVKTTSAFGSHFGKVGEGRLSKPSIGSDWLQLAVGQNRFGSHVGKVEFTTHLRTYFSGWIESDVHWGLTDLDFDPGPCGTKVLATSQWSHTCKQMLVTVLRGPGAFFPTVTCAMPSNLRLPA